MLSKHRYKIFLCIVWFLTNTLFVITMSGKYQLASIVMLPIFFVVLVVSIASVFRNWKTDRFFSLFPLVVCVLATIGAIPVGLEIRDQLFIYRLPQYDEMVQRIETEYTQLGPKLTKIEVLQNEEALASNVFAVREGKSIFVEFLTGGGFPVRHFGYIYSSSGEIPKDSIMEERWSIQRKVSEKWFQFGD